jgi:hypothetical protein
MEAPRAGRLALMKDDPAVNAPRGADELHRGRAVM